MSTFAKPFFTKSEVAEIESERLFVGYTDGSLVPGHDFKRNPFKSRVFGAFINAKERLDGTAKRRLAHKQINSFGWARFDKDKLVFGVKFSSPRGLTDTGERAIGKYSQMLGYLLEQAGWKDIRTRKDEYMYGIDYVVPLNNIENVKLLYTLSPSIGFYYKGPRPEMSDFERLEVMSVAKLNTASKKQSKVR